MTTLHDVGDVLGWPLGTFFWALTIHGYGSWLVCEVALNNTRLSSWRGGGQA